MARFHYYKADTNAPDDVKALTYPLSLSKVKNLLKLHGGSGYTEHWVGGGFEGSTDITVSTNPLSRKSTYKKGRP